MMKLGEIAEEASKLSEEVRASSMMEGGHSCPPGQ